MLVQPRARISWWVGTVVVVALASGSAWWMLRARPSLDGVVGRIEAGQYRAAEAQLRAYLASRPDDARASLMLAKVLVARADPDPIGALRLVDKLRPTDPHQAALARGIEGDAHFWSGRYDRAEPVWLEALQLEPTIPEIGWKLLNIYALQGRDEDSRRLAVRLFASEPDGRDRVQLLLQLIRHDGHPIEAGSIVHALEPIVKANPFDLRSATALGLAMIGCGRADEGLDLLRRAVRALEDDLDVRSAYFDALIATGGLEELTRALDELPRSLAGSPRFDVARGWLAAQSGDLDAAAKAYRKALDVRPTPAALSYTALAHRFKGVLRQSRKSADLAELEPRLEAIINFPVVVRGFFDRLAERTDLGPRSHPDEFAGLAEVLARVGRDDEARAWNLLAGQSGTNSR